MQKTVVVSFEGDKVNIVYATQTKNSFVIDNAVTVADEDFDAFLAKEETREFSVVKSFTQFFSDTFYVPPAKDNLIRVLAENEIRKTAKFKEFSFIHTVVAERIIDQKKTKEVFVFAVDREHIREIVNRFTSRGKVVKAIYPDIFALAGFVGAGSDTVLGVLETETNKHLFVVKEGRILFVRVVQAFDRGMRDHDMQNITMTVNYCRQNLRLNPQRIVLVGHLCRNFFVRSSIGIPIVSFTHPVFSQRIHGTYTGVDYMLPIASLFAATKLEIDLLPNEERTVFKIDKALRYATGMFIMFMALIIIQSGFIVRGILDIRGEIDTLRNNLPNMNMALERYSARVEEFSKYRPLLEAYRKYAAVPDTCSLLRRITEMPLSSIAIDSIVTGKGGIPLESEPRSVSGAGLNTYAITLKGMVHADSYAQMQTYYQSFLTSLGQIKNLNITEQSLDLKTKQFQIKAAYQ